MKTQKLRTIRLYGKLGATFGRVHHLAVGSAAEAVRALCVLLPGFEQFLMSSTDLGMKYAVFYGKQAVTEDLLLAPCGNDDIRIAPVLQGAKSGIFQTIFGAVLVVVGAWTGQGWLVGIGIGMMAGGIAQMLVPTPKMENNERPDNQPSYTFNGPVNVQAQGNPVPIIYGELIVGSAVISASIESKDMVVAPTPDARNPTPGAGRPGWGGGGGGGTGDFAIP